MAITADVKSQLFRQSSGCDGQEKLIRLPADPQPSSSTGVFGRAASPPSLTATSPAGSGSPASNGRAWTPDEHDRFLEGLEMFPSGPWKQIAAHVGTRTTRQTMTHAQKYREKIARRKRGLRAGSSARRSSATSAVAQSQAEATTTAVAQSPVKTPSVDESPRAVEATAVPLLTDGPLDFAGCFTAGPSELGVFLQDVEPLPMSEEEIDQLLDVALLPHAAAGTASPPGLSVDALGLAAFREFIV